MYEIIDIVERIRLMDRGINEKEAIVAKAAAAAETDIGYKRTIANCHLREAQVALDAAIAEYNTLGESIPTPDELICAYLIGHIADLRIKRGDLLRDKEVLGQRLGTEEETLKSGPWRRKGAPMPPALLEIQSKMADIDLAAARIDADILEWMKGLHEEEAARTAKKAFDAWMIDETGEVPTPASVVERGRLEYEEFMRTAERLEIVTPAVIKRRAAEAKAAVEAKATEMALIAEEEAEWIAENARWRAQAVRSATKSREFFTRIVESNKRKVARRAAAATVRLVIEECA